MLGEVGSSLGRSRSRLSGVSRCVYRPDLVYWEQKTVPACQFYRPLTGSFASRQHQGWTLAVQVIILVLRVSFVYSRQVGGWWSRFAVSATESARYQMVKLHETPSCIRKATCVVISSPCSSAKDLFNCIFVLDPHSSLPSLSPTFQLSVRLRIPVWDNMAKLWNDFTLLWLE